MRKKLGERLRELRQQAGMTQRQLAKAAKTSVATVSRVENGESGRIEMIDRIAAALGASYPALTRSAGRTLRQNPSPRRVPVAILRVTQLMQELPPEDQAVIEAMVRAMVRERQPPKQGVRKRYVRRPEAKTKRKRGGKGTKKTRRKKGKGFRLLG